MRRLLAFVLLGFPAISMADAPFCLVSSSGFQQCTYWNLQACRSAAQSLGGMCAANVQPQPQAQIVQPAAPQANGFQQGFDNATAGPTYMQRQLEASRRAAQEQRESEARVRLLDEQIRAQRLQADNAQAEQARQVVQNSPGPAPASLSPSAAVDPSSAKALANSCQVYIDIESGEADSKYSSDSSSDVAARTMQAGYCIGFINGFVSGYSTGAHKPELQACVPKAVTNAQIARVLVKRMGEAPEFEHVPAMILVLGVMRGAWPCPPGAAAGSH